MEHHPPRPLATRASKSNDIYFVLVVAVAAWVLRRLYRLTAFTLRNRRRYHDILSPPGSRLLGNLPVVIQKCSPQLNRHPDYGFEEMWNDLARPACFHLDLAPVDSGFLIVCDPSVAEAITQPSPEYKYSMPKGNSLDGIIKLIGKESLIRAEGEEWRELRRRFNRGFAPAHLHTLTPLIASKTRVFLARIEDAARSGRIVALKGFAQDLTTDIVTVVTMEKDFESQSVPDGEGPKSRFGILTASHILSQLAATTGQGFDPIGYLNPVRRARELLYEQILNRTLYKALAEQRQKATPRPKADDYPGKAIVDLALADLEPSPALLRNTVDQIKNFLFAGQDTTASLIQWLCFELSKADHDPRYRKIVDRLEAEHDRVFGPAADSALHLLSNPGTSDEILGDKIPYTSAFIKETLRVHPPAGTARWVPEASKTAPPFFIDVDGQSVAIDGLRIYICHRIMHRSPKVWGADAHVFNPDRWLDDEYVSQLPPGAWRAFERGPRNCIGQELALMEAKVVLCAVTRALRFEKVGYTGRDGEEEVWGIQNVTTVPVDGMRMRFHFRERAGR